MIAGKEKKAIPIAQKGEKNMFLNFAISPSPLLSKTVGFSRRYESHNRNSQLVDDG